MLSDDGDLYSDEDEGSYLQGDSLQSGFGDKGLPSAADRRAHHNALERKRRDHIKDSFSSLRDSVPSLQGEKVAASRAQILKKAAEYIQYMRKKNSNVQNDIDSLMKQNKELEDKIRQAERNGGRGALSLTSQSLSLLTNEPTDISSSYDISENSNESASNGAGSAVISIDNLNGTSNGGSSVLLSSSGKIVDSSQQQQQLLLNTKSGTIRPLMKNGHASTIIVQNPQMKGSNPQVIHVTSSGAHGGLSGLGVGGSIGNNANSIIISSSSLSSSSASLSSTSNNSNGIHRALNGNSYVTVNSKTGATNAISIPNGYRMVMQQSSSLPSAVTTSPNIHILGTIPSTVYSSSVSNGSNGFAAAAAANTKTKKLKISHVSGSNGSPSSTIITNNDSSDSGTGSSSKSSSSSLSITSSSILS